MKPNPKENEMIMTQKDLRDAFWQDHPHLLPQYQPKKRQNDYPADTRMAWCDFVEAMARSENITQSLAQRATLCEPKTQEENEMKYTFDVALTGYEQVTVEAESLEQAEELALERFEEIYKVEPAWSLRTKSTTLTQLGLE